MKRGMEVRVRSPLRIAIGLVIVLALVIVAAAAGYAVGRTNPALFLPIASKNVDPTLDVDIFWETWNFLKSEYYQQPLDREAIVRGAVRGMLEATGDDNTGYMDPDGYRLSTQDLGGSFEGIGAELGIRDERLIIVSPYEGSPAERAGLRPGDVITQIDGEDAARLTVLEAASKIRGQRGTTVQLRVERPRDASTLDAPSRDALLTALPALDQALRANDAQRAREAAGPVSNALRSLAGATVELDIAIVRDTIVLTRVEQRMLSDGIGYIRLSQFTRNASSRFDEALEELLGADPRALVLDLRRNGGGFVDEAVAVASQFLPTGSVVFVEERAGGARSEYKARGGGRARSLPLVVLIDSGSASAAEILAAALRDHGRARLVGATTYGKGTEQFWHQLEDGSGVRITVARWLTPNGSWVHGDGLAPDQVVADADPAPPDIQLERAIAMLR
jgi:carboxyl-terminal processing protease